MEQWFCAKFSREHWIKILMLTAILSCEDARSLPYAFLSHMGGSEYIPICEHTYLDTYTLKKKQKCGFFQITLLLPFHFNHLWVLGIFFFPESMERCLFFPSLLTSWVPTFFLLLIWHKFNVLFLSAIPAGNLQAVGWKKLSLNSGNAPSPTLNTDTHTQHKHCGVQ